MFWLYVLHKSGSLILLEINSLNDPAIVTSSARRGLLACWVLTQGSYWLQWHYTHAIKRPFQKVSSVPPAYLDYGRSLKSRLITELHSHGAHPWEIYYHPIKVKPRKQQYHSFELTLAEEEKQRHMNTSQWIRHTWKQLDNVFFLTFNFDSFHSSILYTSFDFEELFYLQSYRHEVSTHL